MNSRVCFLKTLPAPLTFSLDAEDTKDHERRRIYFNDALYRIFKICLDDRKRMGVKHRFVFVRENGNPVKRVRTAFRYACERAEMM